MFKTSPYNMLKYANPADDTRAYITNQIAQHGGGTPGVLEGISNVGVGSGLGTAIGGIGSLARGDNILHGMATGAGTGAGTTVGVMGGDALGRLLAPHLATLLAKSERFNTDRLPGFAANTSRGLGTALGGIGGGVMGGLAGHLLTKPRHKEEKQAEISPMVAAFMERCDQLGLNHAKQASIACQMFPTLTNEFYKAGFNPLEAADHALNGNIVGQVGQAAIPFGGVAGGAVGAANALSKGQVGAAIPHLANAGISAATGLIPGSGLLAQAGKQLGGAAISAGAQALGNHISGAGA
jgi:hypothetical protein